MKEERSIGAGLMAIVTLALLFGIASMPWFEYEFSSGRTTPPDGPQPDTDTGVEYRNATFWYDHMEGMEPSDADLAEQAFTWQTWALRIAAGALALIALGELPFIARLIGRPIGVGLAVVALGAIATMVYTGWWWLPTSMAGHGVTEPYTSHLVEPNGYTRTTMALGWYLTIVALFPALGVGLFKFQAGNADPAMVEDYAA